MGDRSPSKFENPVQSSTIFAMVTHRHRYLKSLCTIKVVKKSYCSNSISLQHLSLQATTRINNAKVLIAAKQPLAIFVHCLMYCGSLVISDSLEASTLIVRDSVGIANDVGVLFQRSTKFHYLLENVNIEHASSASHMLYGLYGRFVL